MHNQPPYFKNIKPLSYVLLLTLKKFNNEKNQLIH